MKIEKISKLKNGIYQLTIINDQQEEQKFKFTEDVLIEHNLYSNKVITVSDLQLLNDLANYSKIYTSALNYISFKMRSEQEVYQYLKEKNCSVKVMNEIIEKLKRLNYINDQFYSDAYVKFQFDHNKKGIKVIQDELLKKGIDLKIIKNSLCYIKQDMVISNINHLIHYYLKVSKNKALRKLKEGILRNLMVKGYDYEDVLTCLNDYNFNDFKDDEDLIEKELGKVYTKYQKKYQGHELRTKVIKALMTKGFEYQDILNHLEVHNFDE